MRPGSVLWTQEDRRRRAAILALLALGAGAVLVAVWSLAHGGIGWDSRFDTGAALEARSVDSSGSLEDAYARVPSTSEFYGVALYQLADVLHFATTGATQPLAADDPTTYTYQGIVTLILSVLAVSALAVALAVAFRSLLAATFAWALTLATPLWLGMSHVDFKDVPVAAGITLITAGLVVSLTVQPPRRAAVVGAALAGTGGAIALATRAGSLALIAALAGGSAAVAMGWRYGVRGRFAISPILIAAGSTLVSALAVTWATNPIARIDLLQWLEDSADYAQAVQWELAPMRVAGVDVRGDDLPWWYIPAWLGAQLPLLTLVALVGGVVILAVGLIRRGSPFGTGATIALVPLTLQALILPAAMFLGGAVIYDGLRHLLLMIPALLALAGIGLTVLDRRGGKRLRAALPLGAVVIVAMSLFASMRWAPYSYAFVNPVAGIHKNVRTWDLDYWGVSAKEGVERLERLGYSPVHVQPSDSVGIPFGSAEGAPVAAARSAVYVFLRWNRAEDYGCTTVFTIERDGHILGEGARCPP